MREITKALLEGVTLPAGAILEVGCGGGSFLAALHRLYPSCPLIGMDLNPVALGTARHRYGTLLSLMRGDLHHLPVDDATCAALFALDAFDQMAVQLDVALREAARVLKPGGLMLLRVSAYEWLLGPHDRAFGTGRRYGADEVRRALARAGFEPRRLSHANSLLLLPAILARLAQRQGASEVEGQLSVSPPLNRLLVALLRAEALWLRTRDLPAGLSLYALAARAPA
mgnify:CR=1 FL=1